jgi:hypothetical protein
LYNAIVFAIILRNRFHIYAIVFILRNRSLFAAFSFDSGKFSRHEKARLREAIDNLSSAAAADETSPSKLSQQKRVKATNVEASGVSEATNGGADTFSYHCAATGDRSVDEAESAVKAE